jgi:cell wall-associated NlpC family hydrolase
LRFLRPHGPKRQKVACFAVTTSLGLLVAGGTVAPALAQRANSSQAGGAVAPGGGPAQPAPAAPQGSPTPGGGISPEAPQPTPLGPGMKAVLASDGRTAIAPAGAPQSVIDAIAAANRITTKPYRYGGGHRRFNDSGYDCSGSVSFALRGAGILSRPLDSRAFMRWGAAGAGNWITVYTNPGHAYVVIAGLRFDTSGRGEKGPRWRREARSARGYRMRHFEGL